MKYARPAKYRPCVKCQHIDGTCDALFHTHNDGNHAQSQFSSSENTSKNQDNDCDGNRSNRQLEFEIMLAHNDDDELNGEAEKEEEIEFEKRNVDLSSLAGCCH